jgi:hypothetical protein
VKLKRGRILILLSLLCGVASAGVVGLVGAQTPSATQIHACVVSSTGALRIVEATTECPRGAYSLVWSVTGPPGPVGPVGPQGPAGPTGGSGGGSGGRLIPLGTFETASSQAVTPFAATGDCARVRAMVSGSGAYAAGVRISPDGVMQLGQNMAPPSNSNANFLLEPAMPFVSLQLGQATGPSTAWLWCEF